MNENTVYVQGQRAKYTGVDFLYRGEWSYQVKILEGPEEGQKRLIKEPPPPKEKAQS
jgi:hypothetical protein